MSMSPRLLRPRATGFNPKSISGLALWLDASSSDLYTTDAGPVTAVASPLDIAGCVGWWDASDAASITASGGLVSQWNDRSTAGNHATASGTARPTTGTRSLNGRNVIDFDGTANAMATSLADTATQTVFFVAVSDVASTSGRAWSFGTTNRGVFPNAGIWEFWRQQTSGAISFGTTASATSPSVACALFSSNSSLTTFGNGAQGTTNDPVDSSGGLFNIGKESIYFHNGYVAEIVIYNTALTPTDRARVEAYLAAKWSISGVHAPATASSDPVGYWGDRSGNGRHAVQATAGNRGAISATNQGGRKALAFSATTKNIVSPATVAQYVADATTSPKVFFAFVARPEGGSSLIAYGSPTNPNSNSRIFYCTDFGSAGSHIVDFGAISGARLTGAVGDEADNVGHVYSAFRDGAIMSVRRDGVEILRKTDCSGVYSDTTGTLAINAAQGASGTASWCEFLTYAASMSASNITRIERYLAARWGITLAPQVANADAQDWINRVYSNGGTVSSATAASVNQLCDSLDASGVRPLMYRMGIFAGSNLNAALVPLYLTPDKTVTNLFQYGTDMPNAAWLGGGNGSWTRTATTEVGPLGYGYATKLTTPSAPFDVRQMYQLIPVQNRQVTLSVWLKTNTGTRQVQWLVNGEYLDTFTVTSTWTRYTKTHTSTVSANDGRSGLVTVSELSDAAGFIYGWGMQAEYGATATSYNQPRYGNATDTNTGPFVSGDFADAAGLAAGSGKYLRTGVTQANVGTACHLAFYDCAKPTNAYANRIGSRGAGDANEHAMTNVDVATTMHYGSGPVAGNGRAISTGYTQAGAFWLGINPSATSAILYKNGVSAATASPPARTAQSVEYWLFALNNNGSIDSPMTTGRSGGYSIGLSMDATQAAAYNTAMQAFQTSLTRNA